MLSRLSLAVAVLPFTFFLVPAHGPDPRPIKPPECDADNGGISLLDGFCALVVADEVGTARHLAVSPAGDVYVAMRRSRGSDAPGGVMAMRDMDGDGRTEVKLRFGGDDAGGGTGIALRGSHLYFAPDGGVLRAGLLEGALEPTMPLEIIVSDLPGPGTIHAAKSAVVDDAGNLYVNIGSPSNACQEQDRQAGSPGKEPCSDLDTRAGIWRFDANRIGQKQNDGVRFATGLRNTFALAIHPTSGKLWGVQHGRDQLAGWSDLFDDQDNAEKPAEEFVQIDEGDDFGWPYCYYDPAQQKKVLAPEYGGDGQLVGRCGDKKNPAIALPAHWAPNALVFYTGDQFPERFRNGAFIAFHGSWNRAPEPQGGYNVVFVPFGADGRPTGEWEVFADGFAGDDVSPRGALHRPSGLAVGPDGSLYVADDRGGRIYRIVYTGE